MSEWKKAASDRRDERHIKDEKEVPKHSSKKNTKKWCRGKVGVEHKLECKKYNDVKNMSIIAQYYINARILICTVCGKELDAYLPHSNIFFKSKPKPEWVDK
jgi:ribosomal protein S25